MTDDKFISEADQAERDAEHDARAANLFDLRRIIGGAVRALRRDPVRARARRVHADIDKAAGRQREPVDRAGDADRRRALPVLGVQRARWASSSPRPRGEPGGRTGPRSARRATSSSRPAARSDRDAPAAGRRAQQRQHRAAEAAADHPGAGGAGAALSASTVRSTSGTDAS